MHQLALEAEMLDLPSLRGQIGPTAHGEQKTDRAITLQRLMHSHVRMRRVAYHLEVQVRQRPPITAQPTLHLAQTVGDAQSCRTAPRRTAASSPVLVHAVRQ